MPKLHGVNLSPFVRKVRVFMTEKGLPYDLDPVIPVNVSDEYKKISPLGKIPCYQDDKVTLADSSVICAYLERTNPKPPLYPADNEAYARALWFEEFGDSGMQPVIGNSIFFPVVVAPKFFNQPQDMAGANKAMEEQMPRFFDYLESQIGDRDYLVGQSFTIGDIGICSPLVNLRQAGFEIDAKRWPKLRRYVDGIHARPSFKALIEEEKAALGG
ncbi:MAG: glutathione S-transferase family protein [Deltaproteobacteria bacterium]|nr:glutathione S-transferase family protein [Deltaproteobacteria bacterium]